MWPSALLKLLQMLVWISASDILSCSFFQSGFIWDSIPQLQSSHSSRKKNVAPIYAGPRLHELQQHAWPLQLPWPQLYACSITTLLVEAKLGSLKRTVSRKRGDTCVHARNFIWTCQAPHFDTSPKRFTTATTALLSASLQTRCTQVVCHSECL